MDFIMLRNILLQYPDRLFILDIKETGQNYRNTLEYIKRIFNNSLENLIPQVYCPEDFDNCIKIGYKKCLIALWKCYGDIFTPHCYNLFEHVKKNENKIYIIGISAWYRHYLNPKFSEFKQKVKYNVYFHGQTWKPHCLTEEQMKEHNSRGIYFFKYTL